MKKVVILVLIVFSLICVFQSELMAEKPAEKKVVTAPVATSVININTATAKELKTLPGIGSSTAGNIIEFRTKTPFKTVDDLTKVKRIGKKTLAKLRPLITVSGKTVIVKSKKSKKEKQRFQKFIKSKAAEKSDIPPPTADSKLNINTATAKELKTLPGVGPSTAGNIIEYRKKTPFKTVDDLTKVKGIGKKTLAKFKHLITTDEKTGEMKPKEKPGK